MKRLMLILAAGCLLVLQGCSAGKGQATSTKKVGKSYAVASLKPSDVNEENLDEALRRLRDMNPQDSSYHEMRDRIAQVLYGKHLKAVQGGKNEEAYAPFSTAVRLYSAEEILAGDIAGDVEKMADWAVIAYSPLGDEARVLMALIVLQNRRPDDEDVKTKYDTLLGWIDESRSGMDDDVEKLWETVDIYEAVLADVAVPVVTSQLLDLYRKRHKLFTDLLKAYEFKGIDFGTVYMKYYYMNAMVEKTSYDILKLYTRMGRPVDAIGSIDSYRGKRGYDPKIVALLENMASDPEDAGFYLLLSEIFLEEDWEQAQWSCSAGWTKDASDYRFPLCIARLYRARGDLPGAEEYLRISKGLNDKSPEIYIRLIELYRDWLDKMIEEEKNDDALKVLEKLESTFEAFESRWSTVESPVEWGDIVKRRGLIEFFTGAIDEAVDHLSQAGYQSDDVESLMTLGTIYTFRQETVKALKTYEDALDIQLSAQMESRWFKMLIFKKMGDAARLGGKPKESAAFYSDALKIAQGLLPYIPLDMVGRLHLVQGELNHRLGMKKEAMESFKMAVTLSKDAPTYAGVLSFLGGVEDIESMKEIFHLAYTDSGIEKKWKIYFSMWYLALQKMTGVADDPTPLQVLDMAKGSEWTDTLAAFYAGKLSFAEAKKSAKGNKGNLVELEFYNAFRLYEDGKKPEFTQALKASIDSGYYSFYEVAMALEFLFDMGALK
jgi:tetratricopeptide (TPR) repeat protein